jgi:hypothetical protein
MVYLDKKLQKLDVLKAKIICQKMKINKIYKIKIKIS